MGYNPPPSAAAGAAQANAEAYADTKDAVVVGGAPPALDTLKELADSLGNDPNFAQHYAGLYFSIGTTNVDVANHGDDIIAAIAAGPTSAAYHLNKPTYFPSAPIVLDNGAALVGAGARACTISLPNGANHDIVKSARFDALTGQNKEQAADGVPAGFRLHGVTLDGNRANNAGGRGVAFYGRRFTVHDVMIRDTAGDGWYSELGHQVPGAQVWDDMPECEIGNLWISKAGGIGFHYRGPHDGHISTVIVSQSDGRNVSIESDVAYEGACDVDFIHAYSSQADLGVYLGAEAHLLHLISETNYHGGLVIDHALVRIAELGLFNNWYQYASHAPYADPATQSHGLVTVNGTAARIGIADIRAEHGGAGWRALAPSRVGHAWIDGVGSPGMGAILDASDVEGTYDAQNFSGASGRGLRFQESGARGGCDFSAYLYNNDLGFESFYPGAQNRIFARVVTASAGQKGAEEYSSGPGNDVKIVCSGPGTELTNLDYIGADVLRDGTKILGTRRTGWNEPTGAIARGTFDTATATTASTAQALAAVISDLRAHGLIGT